MLLLCAMLKEEKKRGEIMTYQFDQRIDRKKSNALKWSDEFLENRYGHKDILPMWIADMDFQVAQPIQKALKKAAEHGIYGYPYARNAFYEAIIHWQEKRHQWSVKRNWLFFNPGVIPALKALVGLFSEKGQKVIIQSPVYHPFARIIKESGRLVADNALQDNEGYYTIDFQGLETLAQDPQTNLMIFCSPHNPVGRVWTKEELTKVAEICLKHDVILVSDEIHADLV